MPGNEGPLPAAAALPNSPPAAAAEKEVYTPQVALPKAVVYAAPPPAYTETLNPFDTGARERETMCLLDTTGSFTSGISASDETPRHDAAREMMSVLVAELAAEDSQAAHEADGGGLRTITFAGGDATDIGDLNPRNLDDRWLGLRWSGTTYIMPGWYRLLKVYNDEFGTRAFQDQPALMALIITDGEATDREAFVDALANDHRVFATIVVMGYGMEHSRVLASFRQMEVNPRVRVIDFGNGVDPARVAATLKSLVC
jgi:hypothetical protein